MAEGTTVAVVVGGIGAGEHQARCHSSSWEIAGLGNYYIEVVAEWEARPFYSSYQVEPISYDAVEEGEVVAAADDVVEKVVVRDGVDCFAQ